MIEKTNIKQFENMTLNEIKLFHNPFLINRYKEELEKLKLDKQSKKVIETLYGDSIMEIVKALEEIKLENQSQDLFPGSSILVYSGIKEARANKEYTCDFSGSRIKIGNLYVRYRPMLKNLENNNTYVLKRTIKVEPCYECYLPTNIGELEELNNKINNYQYYDEEDIQYDNLYIQTGGGLQFKKLNRRKYENRNNK